MKIIKNNKKGFTLVELLGVIAVLAIIALITVPIINNSITSSKNKAYENQKKNIVEAAKQWNLDNIGANLGKTLLRYDVMFIMDISGSMTGTRFENTVNAMNDVIVMLMDANPNNRVALTLYENYTHNFMDMDHYTIDATTNRIFNVDSSSKFSIASNVKNSSGVEMINSISTVGPTNTQGGVKFGIDTFINTIEKSSNYTSIPIVMLLTDGEPTYCHTDYINLTSNNCSSSTLETNYYTILTSQYYKNKLAEVAGKDVRFYTVGLDLTSNTALAVLDPTTDKLNNYTGLKSMLESSSNPIKPYNYADMSFTGPNMTQEDILTTFKTALADAISDTGRINISVLVEAGFLDESALIDPRTNETMQGYVEITYDEETDKYTYEFKE